MGDELMSREISKLDILRLLEREYGVKARGVVPLFNINHDGSTLAVAWTGVKLLYEEPVRQAFQELMVSVDRDERGDRDG